MSVVRFFSKPFFTDRRLIIPLWCSVVCLGFIVKLLKGIPNNYLIFKHVFFHTIDQVNLYGFYPEYADSNYYGPIFSLIIAPFTVFPDAWGFILFGVFTSFCLFFAIYKLPIPWQWKAVIYYITLNDMFITTIACQTNTLIAALIIGSFIFIRKEKDIWAACFIALGFFLKVYGIAGLAFFFFSRHKMKFILYFLMWSVVFFVLPMIISSPQFIIHSYADWVNALISKNGLNTQSMLQDYSVMGMMRRIAGNRDLSNLYILVPALFAFLIQYFKTDLFKDFRYQLSMLSIVLISVVIFSSGAESPTYIIAMTGVGIWFVIQARPFSVYTILLLVGVLAFTSFATTDFIPHAIRLFIKTYALKALPCLLIWITVIYQQLHNCKGVAVIDET